MKRWPRVDHRDSKTYLKNWARAKHFNDRLANQNRGAVASGGEYVVLPNSFKSRCAHIQRSWVDVKGLFWSR